MTEPDTDNVPKLAYRTGLGSAYQGDSRDLAQSFVIPPRSVDLIFTSPPFALTRQKDYGNKAHDEYIAWFESFLPGWRRVLTESGSIVVDVGGAYLPGAPKRSTYHFELAILLAKHFDLCQEFYWYNPAKLPSPAQWTNVKRVRVKDSVNLLLWFAPNAAETGASNRRVLKRYSASMRALLKNGYQIRKRPSNHDISDNFLTDNLGAIPSNLLGFAGDADPNTLEGEPYEDYFDNLIAVSNTASTDRYLDECRTAGIKPHNARFPKGLPAFFIEFLTKPGQVVFDPFAGSNTTGEVAELLGRRWISCELDTEGEYAGTYVRGSAFRFANAELQPGFDATPERNWESIATRVRPLELTD